GDVFLVIDGWPTIKSDFEDLEPAISDIAMRGLAFGVHLVATCTRWMDLRYTVRDLFTSRLELRLGEPADSAVHRSAAMNVAAGLAGAPPRGDERAGGRAGPRHPDRVAALPRGAAAHRPGRGRRLAARGNRTARRRGTVRVARAAGSADPPAARHGDLRQPAG